MKRIILFIVNWLFIITAPIWGGWILLVIIILSAIDNEQATMDTITGKSFIFK